MRAWALLVALALSCLLAQGLPLERQPRLSREEGSRDPELQRNVPRLYAGGSEPWTAQLQGPPPQQQQQQQQPAARSWWRCWLWPWDRTEALRPVRVTPHWADGSAAAPVELALPQSHIDHELRPAWPGGGSAAPAAHAARAGNASPPEGLAEYNSSAIVPLIPWAWSWMSDAQQMRNRSNGFDIDTARTLSLYAAITYCNLTNIPAWNCTRCGGLAAGVQVQRVVFDPLWNLMAFVGFSQPLNAVIVSFRGTDSHSLYNWVENMRTWRTDLHINYPDAPQGALVHGGFFYSYNSSSLAANVTAAVQEVWDAKGRSVPVYVVGHSLGGALATICALDVRLNLGVPDVRLYTFGSPRVGNAVFANWFRQYVKVRWRFTHNRDMVPSVPIQLMGFRHVAQEVWLLELAPDHTLVGMCDESGEDPRCHNSMCYMGLCSSISDHLLYLSEMYTPRPGGC